MQDSSHHAACTLKTALDWAFRALRLPGVAEVTITMRVDDSALLQAIPGPDLVEPEDGMTVLTRRRVEVRQPKERIEELNLLCFCVLN